MPIEKFTKEYVDLLGKTSYYLSISAVQKCVRRGDVTRAVNFAKVAWRLNPHRLFSRLWTILYEDCGRDIPALLAFYKHRGGGFEFENIIPLIVKLAQAKKSRDVNCLSFMIRGHDLNRQLLEDELGNHPIHNKVVKLVDGYQQNEIQAYDIWDFGFGDSNFDWTIELAQRSEKFDWEKFGVGSPYFFMPQTYENNPTYCEEANVGDLYDDWFPLVAVDGHTRPGKICFGTYVRKNNMKHGETNDDMDWWMFYAEGWQYSRVMDYSYPFHKLFDKMCKTPTGRPASDFANPEVIAYYKDKIIPDMNGLRCWLLDKSKQDMLNFKWAYAEEWFSTEVIQQMAIPDPQPLTT